MASITVRSIAKRFGETEVLSGVDLEIAHGEFLTLLGPSGCGKSTLLRIIAGLEAESAGEVRIGDASVTGVRPSARDLAMVFQSYALYPHLSVEENMMTPLRLRDLSLLERLPLIGPLIPGRRQKLRAARAAVHETAETLRIAALLKRKPGQLSGGQRQRAALGRAMVRKPAAFLMDEPLSNLDAALRVHMRSELAELHRLLGATFVYVTHDQAEALTMSDRVAVMMGGRILQVSPPTEIYENPRDLRVAEFIGSPKINTLAGQIDGAGRVSAEGLILRRRLAAPAGPVTVAIRPEHLEPVPAPVEGASVPVRIAHKENLGADVYLHGALTSAGGADRRLVARALPENAARFPLGAAAHFRMVRGEAMAFGPDQARLDFAEDQSEDRSDGEADPAPVAARAGQG